MNGHGAVTLITCGLHEPAAERAEPSAGSQRGRSQTPKSVERPNAHPGATAYRGDQVSGKQELVTESGKQGQNTPKLTRLSELPDKCWKEVDYDPAGIQFFTRVRIGLSKHQIMIDGGSAVNSTTDDFVVDILNECSAAGVKLSDP